MVKLHIFHKTGAHIGSPTVRGEREKAFVVFALLCINRNRTGLGSHARDAPSRDRGCLSVRAHGGVCVTTTFLTVTWYVYDKCTH